MSEFNKWRWFDAVLADPRMSDGDKVILVWLVVKAVFNGKDTFCVRQQTVSGHTASNERKVRRAYQRARELGYLVLIAERQRGRGHTRADEYRLEIPDDVSSIPEEIPDNSDVNTGHHGQEYRTNPTEIPDNTNSLTSENDTPISSLKESFLAKFLERGTAAAEPIDVTAVPERVNALSQRDIPEENNIIDGELVDEDDDPEPPYYCEKHRPFGTSDSCPGCKIARLNHEAWEKRQGVNGPAGWLLLAQQLGQEPAPERELRPKCPWCRDTSLVILSDGTPGSLPMWCLHEAGARRPATDEEIAEYERRTA
ncbi:Uncharacterised protein [Mycobacteroides abscessus subsp. abscessus]|uniref:hypothetical protein n=1 Tax=Mycobacteroides abscessus TaxID=36809 RepID=UPI00092C90AC|nr:hypothetical protein [Mycobacteroides abscessus]SHS37557.1 Uncharacterised protein [Mycobacteroides abscessus subsp. abscessus]SHS53183.1 Uncharacterised protein [Mycobacteroides abscessus subsp. abscessus]SHS85414.1 Uncharacterised protein [Mycobacteroides abscessus subsp. abscessus]SHT36841.1 Uncharacterised protein [Mycobacteroides abscessus subsp. abscessus]SHT83282.1 Uncharacterised protein [Mycobacteroides abscessus subsp. abscessus]